MKTCLGRVDREKGACGCVWRVCGVAGVPDSRLEKKAGFPAGEAKALRGGLGIRPAEPGSADLIYRGPDSKYFWLCGALQPVTATLLL